MIFICHSRKDEARVSKLVSWLNEDSFDIWYNKIDIGKPIESTIQDALQSSKVFALCLTPNVVPLDELSMKAKEIRSALQKFERDDSFKFLILWLDDFSETTKLQIRFSVDVLEYITRFRVMDFRKVDFATVLGDYREIPEYAELSKTLRRWDSF